MTDGPAVEKDPMELAAKLGRAVNVSMRHYQYALAGGSPDGPHGLDQSRLWMESSVRYAARALLLTQECRNRKDDPELAKWLAFYGINI